MNVLAVILARGGSKGIPRKNLLPIGGIPLLGRSIIAAKKCPAINEVVVSTDDAEISSTARRFGAEVIQRPAELANDQASSEAALLHAMQEWTRLRGAAADLVLLIQCTAPFQDPEDMTAVIELMKTGVYNSCITVSETYRYFWARESDGWRMPYQRRGRRQVREPWYEEAGSLYCVRYHDFAATGNLFVPPMGAHVVSRRRAFDIDEPEDIAVAEALCSLAAREGSQTVK